MSPELQKCLESCGIVTSIDFTILTNYQQDAWLVKVVIFCHLCVRRRMWIVQLLLLVQVIVYLEFIRLVVLPIVLHLLLSKLCFPSAHKVLSLHRRCTLMLLLDTLLSKGIVKKSLPDNGLVQGVPCSHPTVVCCTWEVLIPLSK